MFGDLFICKNYTFGKVFGQNFDSNCLIRVHGKGIKFFDNQHEICGYTNEIITEIVKATGCQIKISEFIKPEENYAYSMAQTLINETDFWIGDHSISSDWLKMIDYSPVTDCPNWMTLLGVAKTAKHSKFKILTIFDPKIWLLLFVSFVLVIIFNTKFTKNQNVVITLIMSLINHLECLLSKSAFSILNSHSNKILFLAWLWATFLLSTLFSNEILAKLVFKPKIIINSIDHLNEMTHFKAIIWPGQSQIQIGMPFDKIKNQIRISDIQYYNPSLFVQKLIDGNTVLVIRQDRGQFLRDFLTWRFNIDVYISEKLYQGLTGFPMSKRLNPKIKLKIDHLIVNAIESGLITLWKRYDYIWSLEHAKLNYHDDDELQNLKLENEIFPFIILSTLLLFSFIVLLIELIINC